VPATLPARLAIAAVAALVAWAAVAALAHAQPAQVGALSATGAVRLQSDRDGAATLVADHLVPGRSASGTVRLANTGDADGLVELAQTSLTDVPGAGGGRLSASLRLRVEDVTSARPVLLSDGPLAAVAQVPIGRLLAGGTRLLRLTATLPDTGTPASALSGDNALQGASVRMDWTWTAVSVAPAAPTATPAPTPLATPAPTGTPAAAAAPVLTLARSRGPALIHRTLRLRARCSIACSADFGAVLQTAPADWPWYRTAAPSRVLAAGTRVQLPARTTRSVRLTLTPKAARAARRALRAHARVSVLVRARVQSAAGPQVRVLRVVLTAKAPLSRGSARRR
jgi:hypothetical protein